MQTSDAEIAASLATLKEMFPRVDPEVLETYLRVERNFDKVVDMIQIHLKQNGGAAPKKKGYKKGTKIMVGTGNVWGVAPNSSVPVDLSQCLSTKLKREKLAQMFPMLPDDLRESIFKRHK